MKRRRVLDGILTGLLALVWLANGIFAKVLGQVPRHEEIVSRVVGDSWAETLTPLIGLGEMGLAVWIMTRLFRRSCAVLQITLVLLMNVIEFTLARDLLLWGPLNFLFALVFSGLVYFWGFRLFRTP